MPIKGKANLTLEQKTVEMLRANKGSETWDGMLLRLSRRARCGIECVICGTWVETTNIHVSPSVLAEMNGWQEVILKDGHKLGFVCRSCGVSK